MQQAGILLWEDFEKGEREREKEGESLHNSIKKRVSPQSNK